jgi:hypothetical protein
VRTIVGVRIVCLALTLGMLLKAGLLAGGER